MNTQKHTPGPWTVNDTDACIWPTVGRRAPIATLFTAQDPDSEGSAESAGYSAEELANMALLASAPELLEALRAFVDTVEATGGVTMQRCGLPAPVADLEWLDLGAAFEAARAAIAKAEGRR